ncbi:hypothetical protein Pst134EA_004584 [Puccinia striiformis f. sp. tritici]|uniref:hypothetical protein n=1 Tax=Puccinia striiformis f. sp. tritici TaxID=168172 RepID=UPI0020085545|nr:hypothetical protein Pst134EA_004584 [Puccinia striiformis f. sp. tritici]KAH9461720.1 hypothetical protein Pst134EB_005647 [Puccinia striiformis f. sp. tritici]KAH9470657.1 hypothetical protein Pst134EA_004584 [Puccinia striiformis f. sp. tritici]
MFPSNWMRKAFRTFVFSALALFPFVVPSQLQRRASGPQQCGNRYLAGMWNSLVVCWNYGNVEYHCDRQNCHTGGPNDPPDASHLLRSFKFHNCQEILGKDRWGREILSKTRKQDVTPSTFTAENLKGTLRASDASDLKEYRCNWSKTTDANNARPWCNGCNLA